MGAPNDLGLLTECLPNLGAGHKILEAPVPPLAERLPVRLAAGRLGQRWIQALIGAHAIIASETHTLTCLASAMPFKGVTA